MWMVSARMPALMRSYQGKYWVVEAAVPGRAAVSLKVKTSRSNIAHMGYTLI